MNVFRSALFGAGKWQGLLFLFIGCCFILSHTSNHVVEAFTASTSSVVFSSRYYCDEESRRRRSTISNSQRISTTISGGRSFCRLRVIENGEKDDVSSSLLNERLLGAGVLLTVPVAWGTYAPAVRYMYENVTPAVPGIVFSALYYIVACLTLQGLLRISTSNNMTIKEEQENVSNSSSSNKSDATMIAGLELGGYLFVGNWLQVTGLQTVPADRSAFLVQLTTLLVPLTQAFISKQRVPLLTWIACALAFSGVVIMTIDPSTQQLSWGKGDIYILLAAMAYTLHVIRLGAYTSSSSPQQQNISPLSLAASKATVEAFLSCATVFVYIYVLQNQEITDYVQHIIHPNLSSSLSSYAVVGATVLWTGWVTCAYTIYAQSFGQARVTSPTDANLIYSTQPIFSSLFAYFLLHEQLDRNGILGGALIGMALYLIVTTSNNNDNDHDTNTKTHDGKGDFATVKKQQVLNDTKKNENSPTLV